MKAAIAILVDQEIGNTIRKLAVEVHRHYGVGFAARCLPPHISLKQPFSIAQSVEPNDLDAIETYFDELGKRTPEFSIRLGGLDLWRIEASYGETGVLLFEVQENRVLKRLHERMNRDLAERFDDSGAPFDGPDYRFHASVALGGVGYPVYQQIHEQYRSVRIDREFTARLLALFFYDQAQDRSWQYTTYNVRPLSGDRAAISILPGAIGYAAVGPDLDSDEPHPALADEELGRSPLEPILAEADPPTAGVR